MLYCDVTDCMVTLQKFFFANFTCGTRCIKPQDFFPRQRNYTLALKKQEVFKHKNAQKMHKNA